MKVGLTIRLRKMILLHFSMLTSKPVIASNRLPVSIPLTSERFTPTRLEEIYRRFPNNSLMISYPRSCLSLVWVLQVWHK